MEIETSVDLRAFRAAWSDKTKKAKEALQRALEEAGAAIKRENYHFAEDIVSTLNEEGDG